MNYEKKNILRLRYMYYYKIQLYFQPAILRLQHNYITTLRNNGKETYIEQMKVNSYKAQKIMNP